MVKLFQKKAVIIVDAYSTGKYLPHYFTAQGYNCIHVATNIPIPLKTKKLYSKHYLVNPDNFIQHISLENESQSEIKKIVQRLENINIVGVVAGCESGVITADKIAQFYHTPKNDHQSSLQRRHKYYMIDALKQTGLRAQKQFLTDSFTEMKDWYHASGLNKIVLKPPLSSGSDKVSVCHNDKALEDSFKQILSDNTIYGFKNNEVVAQEFLEGTEYMINTVSLEGEHFIVSAWRWVVNESEDIIFDKYADLVDIESEEFNNLEAYIKKVLDAVGVKNGPAHSEIKSCIDGYYLIETNARLAGAMDPIVYTHIFGYNQISLTVEAITNPAYFNDYIPRYKTNKLHARYIEFSPQCAGVIKKEPNLNVFAKLSSMMSCYFEGDVGYQLTTAKAICSTPGFAYLVSSDLDAIRNDYVDFKKLENQFYDEMLT